jgi:uncharacterized membrane protein
MESYGPLLEALMTFKPAVHMFGGTDVRSKEDQTMSTEALRPSRPHPALLRHGEERARRLQDRIADTITRLAGSMGFVYVHIVLFATWMVWFEANPWPT